MKTNPFDSPALTYQAKGYPFNGLIPYRVRMTKTVTPDSIFLYPKTFRSEIIARNGEEYSAWVNSYGAVAVIIDLVETNITLGVKPDEFEVTEWHWHIK
jgi:hypothetical protein